jgi:MFS family permease
VFAVYLVGSVLTPWVGGSIARFGRRRLMIAMIGLWGAGVALTLATSLVAIIVGLAVCAGCGMICQAVSTGYVAATAAAGRSSAVGLYVTCYYVGGSCGAALGGVAWTFGHWPACVALVAAVLTAMAMIVAFAWTPPAAGASLDGRQFQG